MSLGAADGCLLVICSHGFSFVHVLGGGERELMQLPWYLFFIKTLIPLDWGPPLVVSLNLNYFLRGPTSKDMPHGAGVGACVRILVYEFWETHIQFIKM